MNIQTIIFSRDRAMQLDAVLRSFFIHCQDSDKIRVVVLFLASDDVHARQYETLRSAYPDVIFFAQRHFRHDVWSFVLTLASGAIKCRFWWLDSINTAGLFLERLPGKVIRRMSKQWRQRILRRLAPGSPDKTHFLFLVDDNIFVRDFQLTPVCPGVGCAPRCARLLLASGYEHNP